MELKDKFAKMEIYTDGKSPVPQSIGRSPEISDLLSALENLGYRRAQAELAVDKLDLSKDSSFDLMLKETLRELAK